MRKNIKIIMAIMVAATLFTVNNATVKANIDENNATSNDAAVKKVIDSIKSNDSSEINFYISLCYAIVELENMSVVINPVLPADRKCNRCVPCQ